MRYLVSGYYGEGNTGDEAILAGMLQELRRHDPRADFTVLSFDPADTTRRHGVPALPTSLRRPAELLAAMRRADLLISGGGSFLHEADFDVHGRSFLWREGKLRPIPYFLSVVASARAVGRPVMWYAQGLGPLHTAAARRAVAAVGSSCPVVTWRDVDSARLAAAIGVRAPVQLVVPDPAYALTPAPPAQVTAALAEAGLGPETPFLAVCPRPWLRRTLFLEHLARAVGRVASAHDCRVLLVPFQARLDGPACAGLAAHPELVGRSSVLADADDPGLLAGILGASRAAVTMRLHSGILAAAAGTPAAVIDYDPKVRAFARQTGQEAWAVTVDELEAADGPERLAAVLVDTLQRLPERRRALAARVRPLRREAGNTARLAVQVAEAGGLPRGIGA